MGYICQNCVKKVCENIVFLQNLGTNTFGKQPH